MQPNEKRRSKRFEKTEEEIALDRLIEEFGENDDNKNTSTIME